MIQATIEKPEKLAYSVEEVSQITSLSKRVLRDQIKTKKLKAKLVGRRVLILRQDLTDYLGNSEDWMPTNERLIKEKI